MKWNHDEYHQDDYDYNYDARDNNYDLLIDISRKEKPEFVDAPNENHPPSNIDFKSFVMKNKPRRCTRWKLCPPSDSAASRL